MTWFEDYLSTTKTGKKWLPEIMVYIWTPEDGAVFGIPVWREIHPETLSKFIPASVVGRFKAPASMTLINKENPEGWTEIYQRGNLVYTTQKTSNDMEQVPLF